MPRSAPKAVSEPIHGCEAGVNPLDTMPRMPRLCRRAETLDIYSRATSEHRGSSAVIKRTFTSFSGGSHNEPALKQAKREPELATSAEAGDDDEGSSSSSSSSSEAEEEDVQRGSGDLSKAWCVLRRIA